VTVPQVGYAREPFNSVKKNPVQANPARRIHFSALTLALAIFLLALNNLARLPSVVFISFIFLNAFLQAAAGQY
jgi:hypothetical protein